ncbi:probable xyloglucan endotransglucosylase/hydrolase protein 28 [Magnolia sinica]|uniref:probable xyloglucan endotransglucosylase/hydrolase protein 28 n=1 Tax=Magnolia sinica TaxID=86752 RepID=UPI00265AF89C|nr:probable xyloglucan endotransglucosylase/hydrolase protein 28 [Magnolia sinica]
MVGYLWIFMVCTTILATNAITQNPPILAFDEGYTQLFGDTNLMLHRGGKTVHISLDERSGAGFISQDLYLHGFFSASIKLPSDYTAGVVVAFYMSNADIFQKNHDELDFEFLGNIRGKEWRIQTNVYGNGSTAIGREERYGLWFDPSEDFHQYSILWTADQIIFYVDNIPIREIKRNEAMGVDFPSKPMSLYATIWDGSNWATSGGRYKVNYKYAPYIAKFSNLVLRGCTVDPIEHSPTCDGGKNGLNALSETAKMSSEQKLKMEEFRKKYMTYTYCYDRKRYPVLLPECATNPREAERFQRSDMVKFGGHRRHGKRHHRSPARWATTLQVGL